MAERAEGAGVSLSEEESLALLSLLDDGSLDASEMDVETLRVEAGSDSDDAGDGNFSDDDNDVPDDEECEDLKLREYQKELAELALQGHSCVICAPTNSGKTRVAVHIIWEHLRNNPDAKIAFFACKVPLAKQQYETIRKHLPKKYNVLRMTGESKFSMSLHKFLPSYSVVVLTPMILVNHLRGTQPLLNVNAFTLMVFDECHHTREKTPYNNIMYYYLKEKEKDPQQRMPQIIGLTATIGVDKANNPESAQENILKVCRNLDVDHVVIVKESVKELNETVPVPTEYREELERNEDCKIKDKILSILSQLEEMAKECAEKGGDEDVLTVVNEIPTLKEHPSYCQWSVKLKNAVKTVEPTGYCREKDLAFCDLDIITEYLQEYHFALVSSELLDAHDVTQFLKESFKPLLKYRATESQESPYYELFKGLEKVAKAQEKKTNPNLSKLVSALRQHVVRGGEDIQTPALREERDGAGLKTRAIVFVQTRMLAVALSSWLRSCPENDLKALNARKYTSTNVPVERGGMTDSEQEGVRQQFDKGEVRVLVATPVAEEGMNIPMCNLVVKYNYTGNEISTVQARGRCRATGGVSILLGMPDVLERERDNAEKEKYMRAALTKISEMSPSELKREVRLTIRTNDFYFEAIKEEKRLKNLKPGEFKVYCHRCKFTRVKSSKIRTIYEKYRVSIDGDLLYNIKIVPKEGKPVDELRFVGSAKCMNCEKTIGSLIRHKEIPFILLDVRNVVFHCDDEKPFTLKRWTKLKYFVKELSPDDIKDYLPGIHRFRRELATGREEV